MIWGWFVATFSFRASTSDDEFYLCRRSRGRLRLPQLQHLLIFPLLRLFEVSEGALFLSSWDVNLVCIVVCES